MLKARGTIKVERDKSRIAVETGRGIIDYYDWFIRREYKVILQKPLHGAHITLTTPKLKHQVDWSKSEKYHGRKVEFEYDSYLIRGGRTKGFPMFYLKIYSEELDKIKKDLNIREGESYKGLHLTVSTGKAGVRPWRPEIIEIKTRV